MSLGSSLWTGDAEESAIKDGVFPASGDSMVCGVTMGWVLGRDAAGVLLPEIDLGVEGALV